MKPVVTWILIADGTQARVLKNTGPGKGLEEVEGLSFQIEPLKAGEILADRPGRSFSSVGAGRAAMELPTDPVEQREAQFVKSIANMINKKAQKGAFDRIIIAAAPQALGNLRTTLSQAVKDKIMAELPKDLTNIKMPDLPRHFDGILAV